MALLLGGAGGLLYPPETDPDPGGADGLLYPDEPELAGEEGLLYPPDDGLLYKPDDDGREIVDDDLDEDEDENPLAASSLGTKINASSKQDTIPTYVSFFVM